MTDDRKPYELLADALEDLHYDDRHVTRGNMREALERLDLYVVSGKALADVLEVALRQGAADAELHHRSGVARLLRLVLVGP